ncbi:MAG: tryptophan-rich sensory protein [Treponema sp. CETP13]|nr:MAG: tryptophan-rich sensory protein [Treponema sp. CETP13]
MNKRANAWINGLFLVITLVVNTLGALGLINGFSQKEISDMYITLITPSPSTFSIWSLIYILLIISMIVMIVKKDDLYYQDAINEITLLFRITCVLNVLWIVSFSFVLVELSALFIIGFVIVLAMLCTKLKKIQTGKHFLLPLTFGLYTGWLFIATVVNISAALVKLQWNGFGMADEKWAIITLLVAVFLVLVVNQKIRNAAFPLPIAWAFFGIYRSLISSNGFDGQFANLQITTLIGMGVLLGLAVIQFSQNHFAVSPDKSEETVVHL